MQEKRCDNNNHGRVGVPVRCCPSCGKVVNANRPARSCPEAEHAQSRRARRTFCIHCGERLIQGDRIW